MSQELVYTSAPKGLKPGSKGFCTVAMTAGMTGATVERLESLSGYRGLYPLGDARSPRNPINWCHWRVNIQGQPRSVLSRVAFAGADYSQRSNKLAHHIVLEPGEQSPAGPASLLLSGNVARTAWTGEPAQLPTGPVIPNSERPPTICRTWARLTGDAGWAAALADAYFENPARPVYLIYPPEAAGDVLHLFEESMSLLPERQRWEVTFSTYFTDLPLGLSCAWRGVNSEQEPALLQTKQRANTKVFDLTDLASRSYGSSANAEAARDGHLVRSAKPGEKKPVENVATSFASPDVKDRTDVNPRHNRHLSRKSPQIFELEEPEDDEIFNPGGPSQTSSGSAKRASAAAIAGTVLIAISALTFLVFVKFRHSAQEQYANSPSGVKSLTSKPSKATSTITTQPAVNRDAKTDVNPAKISDGAKDVAKPAQVFSRPLARGGIAEDQGISSNDNPPPKAPSALASELANAPTTNPTRLAAIEEVRLTDVVSFHPTKQLTDETASQSEWFPDDAPQAAHTLASVDGLTLKWPDGGVTRLLHSPATTKAMPQRQIVLRANGAQLTLRSIEALPMGGLTRASTTSYEDVNVASFRLNGTDLKLTESLDQLVIPEEMHLDLMRSTLIGLVGGRPACRMVMHSLAPVPLLRDTEAPIANYHTGDEYFLRNITEINYSHSFRDNVYRCVSDSPGHASFRLLLKAGKISWNFEERADRVGLENVPGLLQEWDLLNGNDGIHALAAADLANLLVVKDVDVNAALSKAKSRANEFLTLEKNIAERKKNKLEKEVAELEGKQATVGGSFGAERDSFNNCVKQKLNELKPCNLPPTVIEVQLKANAYPVERVILSCIVPTR